MICPIPLRDFAFSGSQKLKNLLASQGRRLKAGVAKDLGQNRTPLPEAHDTSACPQVRGPSTGPKLLRIITWTPPLNGLVRGVNDGFTPCK